MSRYSNFNNHRFSNSNNHRLGSSFSSNPIIFDTQKIEPIAEETIRENIYNEPFDEPIEIEDNQLHHFEYINQIKNEIEEEKTIPVVPEQDFTEQNNNIKQIIKRFNTVLKPSKTKSKKII